MSAHCRSIQELLADRGPSALRDDPEARQHVVDCEECYAFLEALSEVDAGLRGLEPIDAPDALVERTIAGAGSAASAESQPAAEGPTPASRARRFWPRRVRPRVVGTAVAATLVCVTSWSLLSSLHLDRIPSSSTTELEVARRDLPLPARAANIPVQPGVVGDEAAPLDEMKLRSLRGLGYLDGGGAGVPAPSAPRLSAEVAEARIDKEYAAKNVPTADNDALSQLAPAADGDALAQLAYQQSQSQNQRANEAFGYLGERGFRAEDAPVVVGRVGGSFRGSSKHDASGGRFANRQLAIAKRSAPDDGREGAAFFDASAVEPEVRRRKKPQAPAELALNPSPMTHAGASGISPAERFARERRVVEKLPLQPASGYWENTYVPGDPVMRWLEARLARSDRQLLQAVASAPLELESASRQPLQPFDPPTTSALSVFLSADRRGIEGETRALVQIGIQGANRHSGLRPAMNVGIVLDLRGDLAPEAATSMRALVHAFLAAKEVGDHFSLIAAGRPGGTWVASDAFRHGPIRVALERLELPESGAPEPVLGLEQAVAHAVAETQRGDDPAAPLGSSLVLLVTGQPLGANAAPLEAIAHESAVAGVPISVVGVGNAIALDEIDRLALAGQGNRRLLQAPPEAEGLVARELSALSRVIARALRLRIRLAPGVKLVDVVGSGRLDSQGADRVRQAERSIDRRLARNFGIEADRGEDEEGIQIVIPTFHSGDAHSVVLDVVAPGPGPVADVTVRYKDLVYLRNGVARANLSLGRDMAPAGPLERNVVKSYLAIRLSETLKQAGRELLAGRDPEALALVRDFHGLLASLRHEAPGYQNDADIETDLAMLGEYLAVLDTDVLRESAPRHYLADSLQLSGYFKTVPRQAPEPGVQARAVMGR